ncbi:MAG TPA: hypothetical protein VNF07_09955 [Acidimicrobiales bacterium]|nr:hypothetical protein [Acidimicrobiales bacterium]
MAAGGINRTYLLYRGGAALLRLLPRRLVLFLGAAGGRLAARRAPERRRAVAANLAHVLGDGGAPRADDPRLEALVTEAFVQYGRYWAVTARLSRRDGRGIDRRVTIEGREHFELFRSSSVLYALPHLGVWECGGFWCVRQGLDLTTVVEPASTERLSEFFTKVRSALGLQVLALGPRTATELLSVLEGRGSVALVADRDLVGDGLEVDFFGATTRLPGGPALLALRSGAPLVPVGTYLQPDGGIRLAFLAPLDTARRGRLRDDVRRVTADLAGAFEGLIARDPAQWHVFQPNWPADAPLEGA